MFRKGSNSCGDAEAACNIELQGDWRDPLKREISRACRPAGQEGTVPARAERRRPVLVYLDNGIDGTLAGNK